MELTCSYADSDGFHIMGEFVVELYVEFQVKECGEKSCHNICWNRRDLGHGYGNLSPTATARSQN